MITANYLNPTSQGFKQSIEEFHHLKRWQKIAALISATVGAILTPFILFLGGVAAFRWTVEYLANNEADSVESIEIENARLPQNRILMLTGTDFKEHLLNNTLPLDQKIHVTSDLTFDFNDNLISLPSNMYSVKGKLEIRACESISSLPENLFVGNDLIIDRCHNLSSLPENLSIHGGLAIFNCERFTSFPEKMFIGGDLSIVHCLNLMSLPGSITEWGASSNGYDRGVRICGTGHSEEVLRQLRECNTPHMIFDIP